ncbi:MAG TPA: hypothetical protein VFU72_16160 [Nitrolancea sp.]|nr:hypothetical protein [Nitrolancea sp.]
MSDAHGTLGVVLALLYLGIAVAAYLLASRAPESAPLRATLPPWLTGTAHALLGVQVLMGIILFARHPHIMPVSHAVAGILTVVALGLMVPLGRRYGRARGLAYSALLVAILCGVAIVIAFTR